MNPLYIPAIGVVAFAVGILAGRVHRRLGQIAPRAAEIKWWHRWFAPRVREYLKLERAALPDGTRVRLVCKCPRRDHGGTWTTSWTPRRLDIYDVDDYRLTRDDGTTTYATREAIEVVH